VYRSQKRCILNANIVLLVCVFATVAWAQTPSKPVFPPQFSATITWSHQMGPPIFGRWFYSQSVNKDRFDGMAEWNGERYFAERIFDATSGFEYDIFYQDNYAACVYRKINGSLPHPNLQAFNYVGKALVGYTPVYVWTFNDTAQRVLLRYEDTEDERAPRRFDVDIERFHQATTIEFFEFDAGPQDPELFVIPPEILQNCNPAREGTPLKFLRGTRAVRKH